MKRIVIILASAVLLAGCRQVPSAIQYKLVPELDGLGCIRIGASFDEVSDSIDSSYTANREILSRKHIRRSEMFRKDKLPYVRTPEKYTSDYSCYEATVFVSEDLVIEKADLFFWKDTLHRIWISNSNHCAKDVGEALIWKYGSGEGYYRKSSASENQMHLWGNEFCVAKYQGDITYVLGGNGMAKGVDKWFHEVDIRLNRHGIEDRISDYLHKADSIWKNEAFDDL